MLFKKSALIIFIAMSLTAPWAQAKENIFRIEIGESRSKANITELQERVWLLERAVRQLQDRVFELEDSARTAAKTPAKTYTCVLQTQFDGTFSATRPSLSEARAQVLKQCSDKGGSTFWCKPEKVECGE